MDRREFVASATLLVAGGTARPGTTSGISLPGLPLGDDPLGVRPDFPILANGRTFLNSAYITPSPRVVPEAGRAFLEAKSERPITVGEMLGKAGEVLGQFARVINASPEEVGFVYATSEGENTVANNVPMSPGDNVVVDELHYEGALVAHRQLEKRRGIELRIVRHRDGKVTPAQVAEKVDRRTRLVAVSLVSSINGWRHDVRALADLAHSHGALLHVDAIQALGLFPVDVRECDVDFLCGGTYKGLLAGFGIAPFYIRQSLWDRVPPDRFGVFQVTTQTPDFHFELRNNARRYDYATLPFAEVHQLGASLAYLEKVGISRIEQHTMGLVTRLRAGLLRQGFRLFTPPENRASIISFYVGRPAEEVRATFAAEKIDVTVRTDHVRASVALFNNVEEVDRLLAVTTRLL